ncbi:OsmC family protein [Virgibacillus sp. MSJ-26]|uniref:OsmC family protein n=1 Tax=Virgibacillus sp. MSJ-26 TaxID=2841522 RepID=UPI001C10FF7C|nr:OsmC family protein [Virgibacillus sp. MSJ-26]MBU5468173.1 OsmC family protein [Virgibacillus sp. MSJ-26]
MNELTFYSKNIGMRTELGYGELNVSGDEEHGFRPFQLMVSSIVGCSSGVFRKILEKQRVTIEDLQVQVKVERNQDEANRIEKMTINYIIKGRHLDQDKLYKSLNIARKNCAMVQTVENSIDIEETIETIELSM